MTRIDLPPRIVNVCDGRVRHYAVATADGRLTLIPDSITYIVGARPNFVKMAPVVAAFRRRLPDAVHTLIHTGQHFDEAMSDIFLRELGMPAPAHVLDAGGGTHATQTARVMTALEPLFDAARPDLVLVPGDVNSTLAAALVAAKAEIPIGHVEAGLRSFDRSMPEEINRVLTDHVSTYLFTHSEEADTNLAREGIAVESIFLVGNTMIDTLVALEPTIRERRAAAAYDLEPGSYLLVTLHRPALVDGELLPVVLERLEELAVDLPVLFPVHPRTRRRLEGRDVPDGIHLVPPVGYLDFLSLLADSRATLTDSGGVQEEASHLGIPCFTLRANTERPITVRLGTNVVLGLDPERIAEIRVLLEHPRRPAAPLPLWDGHAAERIVDAVLGAGA